MPSNGSSKSNEELELVPQVKSYYFIFYIKKINTSKYIFIINDYINYN